MTTKRLYMTLDVVVDVDTDDPSLPANPLDVETEVAGYLDNEFRARSGFDWASSWRITPSEVLDPEWENV